MFPHSRPVARRGERGGPIQQRGPSDEDLVGAFLSGDEGAFDLLYERHRDGVMGYCHRLLGSVQDAEEVCVEAFGRLPEGHRPERFRPWIFTVAHRLCVDRLRRRDRWRSLAGRLPSPPEPASPEDAVERRARLGAALDTLSLQHRAAVLLYYVEGLTSLEGAGVLGLRHDQARSRIAYACRLLRERLEDDHER